MVVVVCNEHDHIKGLFRKYVSPSSSPALKLKYIRELTKELLYHSMAEEEVRAARRRVPEHWCMHAVSASVLAGWLHLTGPAARGALLAYSPQT